MNENNLEKLRRLVQRDPRVEPAIDDLDRAIHALLDLRSQLAIVPRAGEEWQSPYALDNADGTSGTFDRTLWRLTPTWGKRFWPTTLRHLPMQRANWLHSTEPPLKARSQPPASERGSSQHALIPLVERPLLSVRHSSLHRRVELRQTRLATGGLLLCCWVSCASHRTDVSHDPGRSRAGCEHVRVSGFCVAGMVAIAMVLDRVYKSPLIGLAGALLDSSSS